MKQIVKPNGDVYARVKVEDGMLQIQLCQSSIPDSWITMDSKIIPQLRQIFTEAEILNYV